MNLPRVWARLPGPVDFLETVLEDLADRVSVLAGLPDEKLCATVAMEVADLVKHRGLGRWEAVRSTEARTLGPSDSMARRFNGRNRAGSVLWIDATGGNGVAASVWADYARDAAEMPNIPRLCIAMDTTHAEACEEDKRLRRRLWRDFVTPLDARAIVERFGRRSGHRPANIALRSALVAELAGTDLALAEKLSRLPLRRILKTSDHPRERIWAAQVAVLFPLVERQRQWLLNAHRTIWRVPYTRKDRTKIRRVKDLEIGDMATQARSGGLLGVDHSHLDWLRRVRNQLAHNEVVSWGTLTSPHAVRIADFRE